MMSLLGSKSAKEAKKATKAAQKAAKPAKPAKPVAPAAARGVLVEKPKANIYTVLLILSFVGIVIGCICLYAEMSAYNFEFKARG
ncbi:MAG: hypothetical protein HY288_12965 [Planctomycetia bacterium]|nr:hypothetical protein [Planctomycetia bacterium]